MRRFSHSQDDVDTVNGWLGLHGLQPQAPALFPEIGFLEDDCAVGFLLRTEVRSVAILDGFVTNPAAPARARFEAVRDLIWRLEGEAHLRGVRTLGGWTKSRGMARICRQAGFTGNDQYVALGKELR